MDVSKKERIKKKDLGVYMPSLLYRKIQIPFHLVGKNLKQSLEKKISFEIEGKCTIEGYIKPKSINILTYSSGILRENLVEFDVAFECMICCPVEGMLIPCSVKNITQAGIKAVIPNEDKSPIVVYVTRDHNYDNKLFIDAKIDDTVTIKVIGQRFELNDEHVSIIGEIVETQKEKYLKKKGSKKQPKLVIKENI